MDIGSPFIPGGGKDRGESPVAGKSKDFAAGFEIKAHSHRTTQLLYAVQGVMVANTDAGQWVVPPTHGLWLPAGTVHQVRMVGEVQLRTLYFQPATVADLPNQCRAVGVSPLLRQLILAAIDVREPYTADSRDGRLMRLLLDEIAVMPNLPLRLPYPMDTVLLSVCRGLVARLEYAEPLSSWSERLGIHAKTIERRFLRETGLTFGQWRQQARLITALERLARGDKVVDVALELGYSGPSAFATMFRKHFGVQPSAYFHREKESA